MQLGGFRYQNNRERIKLRLVPVTLLRAGMKLGKKIFNENGMVLLSEGVELTPRLIERLGQVGIGYVYIEDAVTEDIVIPEMIHEQTRAAALQEIKKQFQGLSSYSVDHRNKYFGKSFYKVMESILDDIGSRQDAIIMLMDIGAADQDLYHHSLNVCLYTLVLGIANGYDHNQLMELGIGSLLHDIGKMKISPQVLYKPGKLTDEEYEHMKTHTEIGYKLLKDEPGIPLLSAHCALQHHERIDGSGYPNGWKKDQIHEYAKWIGLVDSYDAMTASRIYKQALLPYEAMEVLYAGAGTLYEQRMLEAFRDCVAIYPLGLSVVLNTGEEGVVVRIHPKIPQRPVIRIVRDRDGQELKAPYDVDLSVSLSVMITNTLGATVVPFGEVHVD
ncbi:HD-GYP domain-containing protein [Paenibacillus kribbensis]|uniref:HD-GYP domain-containing protein n=1 Tax=Paenibacillus kribbensis TaxID=172713 RepID=UPI0015BA3A12|nr:HD-GYP domain-containing protein [Paenibacillus kribbensis]